jgi:hypothetical protein
MDTRPHAFVVMPFGTKTDADGQEIQFNEVHKRLIRPALDRAGLKAFRADEEQRAGDIRADMFQELLLADLVLADISIDNPNVWYELGVRHALRSRGVVLISGGRTPKAFDIYTDRKLRYNLANGVPDPAHLKDDLNALVAMLTSTMTSWRGRTVSPVYSLLPNLEEPQWKKLRVGGVCEYWDTFDSWKRRLEQARRLNLLGDMLVLADEAPLAALRGEGLLAAGKALRKADRFALALDTLERGRPIVAADPELKAELLREQGICLERLAITVSGDERLVRTYTLDRVRDHYRQLLDDLPRDPKIAETHGLAARVEKQAWVALWSNDSPSPEQRRQRAIEEKALLQLAIDGFGPKNGDGAGGRFCRQQMLLVWREGHTPHVAHARRYSRGCRTRQSTIKPPNPTLTLNPKPVTSPPKCVSKQFSSEPQSTCSSQMLLQVANEDTASRARFHHDAAWEWQLVDTYSCLGDAATTLVMVSEWP